MQVHPFSMFAIVTSDIDLTNPCVNNDLLRNKQKA